MHFPNDHYHGNIGVMVNMVKFEGGVQRGEGKERGVFGELSAQMRGRLEKNLESETGCQHVFPAFLVSSTPQIADDKNRYLKELRSSRIDEKFNIEFYKMKIQRKCMVEYLTYIFVTSFTEYVRQLRVRDYQIMGPENIASNIFIT